MYYPGNNAAYNPNGQWQQQQPPLPQGGGPPPPPPAMTPEAAAAYENYGYGNVAPPRPGKRNGQPPHGRGPQAPPAMYQQGAAGYPASSGQPPTMQPGMAHPPPGAAPYPPAKRTKYDSTKGGAASPVYMQQPPHAGTPPYQGQVYQPTMYQAAGHSGQPQQQPMALHMGQAYYPQQAYMPQAVQPPYHYQPQMHRNLPQSHQHQGTSNPAPPLAVALMKATPMASNGNNTRAPPPPPSSAPLPPPPPSDTTIPSGPKGLASLPERPMTSTLPPTPASASSSTSAPSGPAIPTGPSAFRTSIKRDTRPLPSQSRHVGESLRGPGGRGGSSAGGAQRGRGPPTGPSSRGGGGGRGGRGGRSGFDNQRGPNRPSNQQNRRDDRKDDHAAHDREKGAKRTFSQTGPPANSPRGPATRPRTNSNATATSGSVPSQPSKKNQASATKKRERNMEGSPAPSSGSNSKGLKRTLTDFRIESLEIPLLNWSWKATPLSQILAKMNLKEKEEVTTIKREASSSVIDEDAQQDSKQEEKTEEDTLTDATTDIPHLERVEETSTEVDAAAPASTEMQKSDSRPEKRKHARDEDDEEEVERARLAVSEEIKDAAAHPVGKKVKSEAVESAVPILEAGATDAIPQQSEDTGLASDATDASIASAAINNDAIGDVKLEQQEDDSLAAADTAVDAKDAPANEQTSDTSESEEEIADSIIANRPSETKADDAHLHSTPHPAPEDVSADKTVIVDGEEDESPLIITRTQVEDPPKSVPKKFWENSRLRIYFMSPVELEQKDVRQNLLKKPKLSTASAPTDSEQSVRESSVETITSKTVAASKVQEPAETEETKQETETGENDEVRKETEKNTVMPDDLDGEPLGEGLQAGEGEGKAADSDCQVEVKEDQAADSPVLLVLPSAQEGTQTLVAASTTELRRKLLPPSADRLSIAYAQNTRRLIIDAEVVDELVLYRSEGKIEITVRIEEPTTVEDGKEFRCARGIYVESSTSAGEHSYEEIGVQELHKGWSVGEAALANETLHDGESVAADHLSPPLHRLSVEAESSAEAGKDTIRRFTIIAKMDRAHPLTEAKWVRTGNPDDWISSVIGSSGGPSSLSSGARAAQQLPKGEQGIDPSSSTTSKNVPDVTTSAWKGKIRVVDPDAPPTFHHALENWLSSANSRNGFDGARYRFVNEHFQDINNVLEVLLRLIRGSSGGNANNGGFSGSGSGDRSLSNSTSNQSSSLASQALASGAPYPEAQTPVSLVAFELFRMGMEAAIQAGTPRKDIDRRVGEIIRNLPYSLIFRSLDSMYAEFKAEHAGSDPR